MRFVPTDYNYILRDFSLRSFPNGKGVNSLEVDGEPRPTIMLGRVDGKDLDIKTVYVMYIFISECLAKAAELSKGGGPASYEVFHAHTTPEKFVEFWKDSDKCQDVSREDSECPVTLGCKACGKVGGDADKLLRCGKCGVVKYCDRECQKSDWDLHKKACFKP